MARMGDLDATPNFINRSNQGQDVNEFMEVELKRC